MDVEAKNVQGIFLWVQPNPTYINNKYILTKREKHKSTWTKSRAPAYL